MQRAQSSAPKDETAAGAPSDAEAAEAAAEERVAAGAQTQRGEGETCEVEVLMGQIEVCNALDSSAAQTKVNNFPGEFRFLGGRVRMHAIVSCVLLSRLEAGVPGGGDAGGDCDARAARYWLPLSGPLPARCVPQGATISPHITSDAQT